MNDVEEHHPSKEIYGEVNSYLRGLHIVLGVTASVAIYRSLDLARWFVRRSARVSTVATPEASKLVSPELFRWATGGPVYSEFTGDTEHIVLARSASSMVVAPATLSTMAKIASGVVDNPVALTAVSLAGEGKPVTIVPAMHGNMYNSPQAKAVVSKLESQGSIVIPPVVEKGVAKYPELHTVGRIAGAVARRGARDLEGRRVLITLGATREWIDRVRFVSNPSSGAMGVELGLELYARGATVDVIAGYTSVSVPHVFNAHRVETTREMAEAMERLTREVRYDAIIASGAPVDFAPRSTWGEKIKSGRELSLVLEPTPKVLERIVKKPRVLVAFAAEYVGSLDDLKEPALEKLEKYGADLVVANRVGLPGVGFSSPELDAIIVDRGGRELFRGREHKEVVAAVIVDIVSDALKNSSL